MSGEEFRLEVRRPEEWRSWDPGEWERLIGLRVQVRTPARVPERSLYGDRRLDEGTVIEVRAADLLEARGPTLIPIFGPPMPVLPESVLGICRDPEHGDHPDLESELACEERMAALLGEERVEPEHPRAVDAPFYRDRAVELLNRGVAAGLPAPLRVGLLEDMDVLTGGAETDLRVYHAWLVAFGAARFRVVAPHPAELPAYQKLQGWGMLGERGYPVRLHTTVFAEVGEALAARDRGAGLTPEELLSFRGELPG